MLAQCAGMTHAFDAERMRAVIRAIQRRRQDLTWSAWTEQAGVSDRIMRRFLKGETAEIELSAVVRLAAVVDVTVSQLIGETPLDEPEADEQRQEIARLRAALRDALQLVRGLTASTAETAVRLEALAKNAA
jgi:transcriptional regulator with XRE-family HTH domain